MTPSIVILLLAGLVLLVLGGEMLVRGASRLALTLGMPPLAIGLTVVAFGTGAPEVAASVAAALRGEAVLAFGNVVGSNIFNVLFILGLSALITPLVVAQKLIRIDVPVMIGASLLAAGMARDGIISKSDGLLLLAGLVVYTIYSLRASRQASSTSSPSEYELEYGPAAGEEKASLVANLGLLAGGLALLILGAGWLVDGAVQLARSLGVSELIIGLTIIAAGTSLPEVATSVLAALRGERDIAVGNIIGSNIFNLFGVLGITSVAAPQGVPAPAEALSFDVPVMVAVALACLPLFFTGHLLARWEGGLLFGYYIAYTVFLLLEANGHHLLNAFGWAMMVFVIPLTVITLAVIVWRQFRRGSGSGPDHSTQLSEGVRR